MSDQINWEEKAEKYLAWANENQAQADEYMRALMNICKATAPGAWEELFRVTLTNARDQIKAEKAAVRKP
jgi:hypothetical protein